MNVLFSCAQTCGPIVTQLLPPRPLFVQLRGGPREFRGGSVRRAPGAECFAAHLSTLTSYQVVAGLPTGIFQPAAVFLAMIGPPMGRPEPSRASAVTFTACSRFRRVIVPVTGSIK